MTETAHQIASKAAKAFVQEAEAAGLTWEQIAVGAESFLAIVAVTACVMHAPQGPERWLAEMIDEMTRRAHERAASLVRAGG